MNKKAKINRLYDELKLQLTDEQIFVPGEGNHDATLMLVGEAPGAKETELGRPFVGAAGKNLDEFLHIIHRQREDIYISNVVKFRPYKIHPTRGTKSNRPPSKKEINICISTLFDEINIVSPKILVTLGNTALKAVIKDNKLSIGECHGTEIPYTDGVTLFALYHPASIIYNRSLADIYKEDLCKLSKILNMK
jgi:DNA polymerase